MRNGLEEVFPEESADAAQGGAEGAALCLYAAASGGVSVLESVSDDADGWGVCGGTHGLGENVDAVGQSDACGNLEDGFGEGGLIVDGGGSAGEYEAADKILGQVSFIEILVYFSHELAGACEDDIVQLLTFDDGGCAAYGAF